MGIATGLVYVGGAFTTVAGVSRLHVAALDATSGAASNWQPNPDGDVYALFVNYDVINITTHVYLGGSFGLVFGFPRANFAHVDATPTSPTFNQPTAFNPSPNGAVRSLVVAGRTIIMTYMGGDFTVAGGQPRARLAAFSGANLGSWNPGADNTVVSLRLSGTTMYVGGYFGTLGGQPRPFGGAVARRRAARRRRGTRSRTRRCASSRPSTRRCGSAATSRAWAASRARTSRRSISRPARRPHGTRERTARSSRSSRSGACSTPAAHSRRSADNRGPTSAQLDAGGNIGAWNPAPDGDVRAIAARSGISGSTIFLGGTFTNVMNTPRNRLAAVSDAVIAVALELEPGRERAGRRDRGRPEWVYVAGKFTGFAGLYSRQYVAQLDPSGVPTDSFRSRRIRSRRSRGSAARSTSASRGRSRSGASNAAASWHSILP